MEVLEPSYVLLGVRVSFTGTSSPSEPPVCGGLWNDCPAAHADCFLRSLRGCLWAPDAEWQVHQESRNRCPHCISEGTRGAAPGQESKPTFLSLGRTPGRLHVMGISSVNVANSPPGRRARVCPLPAIQKLADLRHTGHSWQCRNKGECVFVMREDLPGLRLS